MDSPTTRRWGQWSARGHGGGQVPSFGCRHAAGRGNRERRGPRAQRPGAVGNAGKGGPEKEAEAKEGAASGGSLGQRKRTGEGGGCRRQATEDGISRRHLPTGPLNSGPWPRRAILT
jgi:hypothetical protein